MRFLRNSAKSKKKVPKKVDESSGKEKKQKRNNKKEKNCNYMEAKEGDNFKNQVILIWKFFFIW